MNTFSVALTLATCLFCRRTFKNLWTAPMSDEIHSSRQSARQSANQPVSQIDCPASQLQICAVARRAWQCHSLNIKQAQQSWHLPYPISQRRHFISPSRAKKLIDPWSASEWATGNGQLGPLEPGAPTGRRAGTLTTSSGVGNGAGSGYLLLSVCIKTI